MNAPITHTHTNCLGINSPIECTSVTQKDMFPNDLCNHIGPHTHPGADVRKFCREAAGCA